MKVFAVDGQAGPSSAAAAADASPGRAYLERRRAERDDAERRHDRVLEEADAVHERLTRLAVASRRYPPQDPRLTGFRDEMVLNAAYLLPEGGEAELRRVTQEPPGTVIRMELTGPWAPYSFATLEEP